MICSRCSTDKTRDQFGPSAEMWPSHRECKACSQASSQRKRHGITAAERALVAEAQGGCRICKRPKPGQKGWCVDHDRDCCPTDKSCQNCRRGVVCQWCNSMLGYAHDNPEILAAGIEYLNAPRTCDWHHPIACSDRLCTDRDNGRTGRRALLTSSNHLTFPNARETSGIEMGLV